MTASDRDYVLGTHDEEIGRLGLQHEVWRERTHAAWHRAGFAAGMRLLDVGAGPGFATVDLARLAGPGGGVVAVERSARYAAAARERCVAAGQANVTLHELDLMADPLPGGPFDGAWCRWVACFVASPATLVKKIAGALKPGGRAVFHEYADYESWRLFPRGEAHREFVAAVMKSWRASGGEPDIALQLPALLADAGLEIASAAPLLWCTRPGDPVWRWPAAFIEVNVARLRELGFLDAALAARIRDEFVAATADPRSLMLTPMVLEIVAEKRS